jgi:2-alkyl-3-oxoalkanoate reductase
MDELRGRAVLVTGASGFIGGRLAERLAQEQGAKVTGTGRTFPEEQSLRAAGVTPVRADLGDADAMAELCEGQAIVFHVAAWMGTSRKASPKDAHAINVDATVRLVEAAAKAKVGRFVLVSTVGVYGQPADDDVVETTPMDERQADLYNKTKAIGEREARAAAEKLALPMSVVRPGMVYGPRSAGWTVGMVQLVKKGVPVLFGAADGHALPIHVDDLVDLIVLAGVRPEAVGEVFNGTDAPISWAQFFGYYGAMSGKKPRRVPLWLARGLANLEELVHVGIPLTKERLDTYVRKYRFVNDKAKQRLGWSPKVPIDEGMKQSEAWLREKGLL